MFAACGWRQPPSSEAPLTLGRKAGAQSLFGRFVMPFPAQQRRRSKAGPSQKMITVAFQNQIQSKHNLTDSNKD